MKIAKNREQYTETFMRLRLSEGS